MQRQGRELPVCHLPRDICDLILWLLILQLDDPWARAFWICLRNTRLALSLRRLLAFGRRVEVCVLVQWCVVGGDDRVPNHHFRIWDVLWVLRRV